MTAIGPPNDTDRAVSTTVSYTLAITITIVLVAGLMTAVGGLMEGQTERSVDSELRIIAEGTAVELGDADRLITSGASDDELVIRIEAPTAAAGQPYTLTLTEDCPETDATNCLVVATSSQSYETPLNLDQPIDPVTRHGGTIWVGSDDGNITFVEDGP